VERAATAPEVRARAAKADDPDDSSSSDGQNDVRYRRNWKATWLEQLQELIARRTPYLRSDARSRGAARRGYRW
jgi:hypothetical protein